AGGSAARARVVAAGLADLPLPEDLAPGPADGEDVGGTRLVAHRVDPVANHADAGEPLADAGALPDQLRACLGPALEQSLLGGDVVAVGPAELGPVLGPNGRDGQGQRGSGRNDHAGHSGDSLWMGRMGWEGAGEGTRALPWYTRALPWTIILRPFGAC